MEVEVRVDDDGFHGSWFEATVSEYTPARGARTPARYTVTYAHLLADDGGGALAEPFAPTHIRPRPPPLHPPPRLRLHDVVEAFHNDGWWSGIVVATAADPDADGNTNTPSDADADAAAAAVTVAFPITREVIEFTPPAVRPRRDYVNGAWVPSRDVVAVRPKRGVKSYAPGEKVEVVRDRDPHGYSWFPATVARAVDPLSYVVEYTTDLEDCDHPASEYLHWRYIRPAVEHSPRAIEFRLGPGAAVEAYCDGAWSPGVVRRVVGEGEYEVSIAGKKGEVLVTQVAELLKPQYKWNGKQWKIVSAKRHSNLRRRSLSGRSLSSPVNVVSSDDELRHDPESSATKRARKEPQLVEVRLAEGSEYASVSDMNTPLSALCKPPERNLSPNSLLAGKNSLELIPAGETLPFDVPLSTPVCETSAVDVHDMLSIAELRTKMTSARRDYVAQKTQEKLLPVKACKVKKDISKSKGEKTHPIRELQRKNGASDNVQLMENGTTASQEIICALSASVEQASSGLDRQVSRQSKTGSNMKVKTYKKLASKKGCKKLRNPHSSLDAASAVKQGGKENVTGPTNESALVLLHTKSSTQQHLDNTLDAVSGVTNQELSPMVPPGFEPICNGKGTGIHGRQLDENLTNAVNKICQASSVALQNGGKVNERSIVPHFQNAGSSLCTTNNSQFRRCSAAWTTAPPHLVASKISGHQVPFVKSSPAWALIESMAAFKEVPQRPHFLPVQECTPALREGTALGLMLSYANIVESIRSLSIQDSVESFEDKIRTLCHLEANGFNVKWLQSSVAKMQELRSNCTDYLGEMSRLQTQMDGKATTVSEFDALLDEKDEAIAELEQKLGQLRQEAQKIAKHRDHEDAELSKLKSTCSRFEEAYRAAERLFRSILQDDLHRERQP